MTIVFKCCLLRRTPHAMYNAKDPFYEHEDMQRIASDLPFKSFMKAAGKMKFVHLATLETLFISTIRENKVLNADGALEELWFVMDDDKHHLSGIGYSEMEMTFMRTGYISIFADVICSREGLVGAYRMRRKRESVEEATRTVVKDIQVDGGGSIAIDRGYQVRKIHQYI